MKLAPVGTLLALKVKPSPSGSLADAVKIRRAPSSTLFEPMASSTGGRFTLPTVMITVSESFSAGVPLSVTVKVTL